MTRFCTVQAVTALQRRRSENSTRRVSVRIPTLTIGWNTRSAGASASRHAITNPSAQMLRGIA